jgi:hypothetical protein
VQEAEIEIMASERGSAFVVAVANLNTPIIGHHNLNLNQRAPHRQEWPVASCGF